MNSEQLECPPIEREPAWVERLSEEFVKHEILLGGFRGRLDPGCYEGGELAIRVQAVEPMKALCETLAVLTCNVAGRARIDNPSEIAVRVDGHHAELADICRKLTTLFEPTEHSVSLGGSAVVEIWKVLPLAQRDVA